jgi:hypothetical protein
MRFGIFEDVRIVVLVALAVLLDPVLDSKDKRETKSGALTGCEAYRADFDMYTVCQKRGLPSRQSSRSGFAFRPIDQELASAPLPAECRDPYGQPVWQGAPEVVEWVYCDNLHSGCEYYLFVQKFTTLEDLKLKDNLTAGDKARAFVQACRQETFGGAHELAYVGTYPLDADQFLDVLFGTQTAHRPKDTFGLDGMRRQAMALAAPAPFKLESVFLDPSLQPAVRKVNTIIREFETYRQTVLSEPAAVEKRDLLFVQKFSEEHAKGVLHENKPSNVSAADALKKAVAVYPRGDPQRQRYEDLEHKLRQALHEFDAGVDAAIKTLSRPRLASELVYHPGDTVFLFFKGTGSIAPKLKMKLKLQQLGSSAVSDIGSLTRAFDDDPETNRQNNVVFAIDYQQYWVAYFTQPFLIVDRTSAQSATKGIEQNGVFVADAPGDYLATIELSDETTGGHASTELRFTVAGSATISALTPTR